MTKRFSFFATREDLVAILLSVEQLGALSYRRLAAYVSPDVPAYDSCEQIPSLGVAVRGSRNDEPKYLVTDATTEIALHRVDRDGGKQVYILNQFDNPDSVILNPAGVFGKDVMICGECVTMSKS